MSNSAFTPQSNITAPADASTGGIVSTTAQVFAGVKTFTNKVISDTHQAATSSGITFKEDEAKAKIAALEAK